MKNEEANDVYMSYTYTVHARAFNALHSYIDTRNQYKRTNNT